VQLPTNYISYFDYTSQYAPEVHEKMANIYGNQSISGMLYMLGSEKAFASDQVIWTEEGRLHTIYTDVARSSNVFTKANHVFRVGETIHISDASYKRRAVITAADTNTFTAQPYKSAGFTALGTTGLTVFVDGSEFKKGTAGMAGSLETDLTILSNKPIILKDFYEVSGSDATQISWVQTANGGWLWYLQSEYDMRRRWEDRLELALLNGEKAETGSDAETAGLLGTEGLFEAITKRGNVFSGVAGAITDWDNILKRFDAQGKISDYILYADRDQSLAIDNMLGALNAGYSGGISYGVFNNSESMAANLGFKGFTRGSYSFFKSDYKLLNDPTLLGAVAAAAGKVRGLLIPVGTTEVYEGSYNGQGNGQKITTPFLEMQYRQAGIENRKFKSWVLGTVGSVKTNSSDSMEVHMLSERLLKVVGANNFMVFTGA
jgi:hypothetical protein